MENDGDAAAIVEHRLGSARGTETAILITLGTGVGSGTILNSQLFPGGLGSVAELGHACIDYDGPVCYGACHGRGHVERYMSGTAIRDTAVDRAAANPEGDLGRAAALGEELTAEAVIRLARKGPGDARALLVWTGHLLGIALATHINFFGPEVIVVGGGVAAEGDLLLDPAKRVVAEQAQGPGRSATRIVRAALGDEAGLVGAALAAFDVLEDSGRGGQSARAKTTLGRADD